MSNLNSILLSLKKSLAARGYNIDDLIEDYDKRHTGEITAAQFDRLISSFSLLLEPSDYQMMRSTFMKDNRMIDMIKFSSSLKDAHEEVKQRGEDIQSYFIDLHNRLTQRNQSLRDLLRPYDRKNRGLINPYDFIRAVGSFPSSRALSESYTQNGLINLNEFLSDYEKALQRTGNDSNSGIIRNESRIKPPAIETAIKQINIRNVDMRQLFLWQDRFRIGKINRPNFQTALADAGLQLTPSEFNSITEYYSLENGFVDYSQFLNDCQNDQSIPEQKIPENYGRTSQFGQTSSLNSILSNIVGILRERKVQPANLFPPNTQILSKYQFSSVVKQMGLNLTNEEIDVLIRSFETQQRDVDVFQFIRTLDNLVNEERMTMTRSQREAQMNDMNVVSRIKNALKEKSVQLAPRFSRFDRENSGEFNVSLVNSVLQTLGIEPMTQGELEVLQSIFPGSVAPNIKWHPFTEAVDPPIEECYETLRHNSQRQLNMSIPFGLSNDEIPQRHEMIEKQRAIPPTIASLLEYISTTAKRYRMSMMEEFRSLDRFRSGFLTPNIFFSFMSNNFSRLNRQQLDLLLNNYGTREFHYIDFCKDLETVESNSKQQNTQLQTGPYNPNSDLLQRTALTPSSITTKRKNITQSDLNEYDGFLRRLKAFCVCRMMKPLEIFQRHDTMNLGYINKPRFEGCFTFIQFPLSRNEVDILTRMFCDDDHEERIIYTQIVRDLEKLKIEQGEAKWILNRKELQQELDSEIIRLLNTIREKLNQRNRRIRTYFSDLRPGEYISPNEFIRRIEMSNIVIPRNDIDKLMEKYMVGGVQKWNAAQDQSSQVDWEAFTKDVENSRFL